MGCWHGYLSGARCRLAYGPADAIATHCPASVKSRLGLPLLVPPHLGSPGQRAVKCVCVLCVVCTGQVLDMRAMKCAHLVDFVHGGCTVIDKNTGIIRRLFLSLSFDNRSFLQ